MGGNWDGNERRKGSSIRDEDFDAISRHAADLVESRFYERIGRAFWEKLLWVLGALGLAALAWLHGAGKITIGSP